MGQDTPYERVIEDLLDDVTAIVGTPLIRDNWVEHHQSRDVIVRVILEGEWVRDVMSKLRGGAGERV